MVQAFSRVLRICNACFPHRVSDDPTVNPVMLHEIDLSYNIISTVPLFHSILGPPLSNFVFRRAKEFLQGPRCKEIQPEVINRMWIFWTNVSRSLMIYRIGVCTLTTVTENWNARRGGEYEITFAVPFKGVTGTSACKAASYTVKHRGSCNSGAQEETGSQHRSTQPIHSRVRKRIAFSSPTVPLLVPCV